MRRRSNGLRAWCLTMGLVAPAMVLVGCQPAEVGTVGKPREVGGDGNQIAPKANPRAGTEAPAKGSKGKAQAPDTAPRK